MATAQETRFLRLALTRRLLSRDQLKTCLQVQQEKQQQGSKIPLWDCTVLENVLDQNVAEKLQEEAGDLDLVKLGGFTLVRKVGEGGMGAVWLAVGPDDQRIALKVLPTHLAKQRPLLTRFFREAQATIRLQHENIVRGVKVGEDSGRYFFAMEFIAGKSVRNIMDESGALSPDEATGIARQVAEGLAYAHANGIIHRDIKPDNIMVTKDGVAKLADLGLVRQLDAEMTALTRTGTGMGTPYYMAPEQSTDAKHADVRSDIYSLGATWYHMVTGQFPFDGSTPLEILQQHMRAPLKSPQTVRTGIPRAVSMTIERMMAKKPEDRIQTAAELCEIIDEQCLGERDIARELGLAHRRANENLWDMKVAVGDRVERRRFSVSEIRERMRKGQITRETPARRSGTRAEWQPAGAYRELQREFPQDYAVRAEQAKQEDGTSTRAQLHDLVSHFDRAKRSYSRKKKAKRLLPILLELAALAVIIGVAAYFWPQIREFAAGLLGKSAQAP